MAERRVVDVRALGSTREVVAYKDGGEFPVLATTPRGTIAAVLRGGAGHIGREGRMELLRSPDGGRSWSPPATIADTDADDRNPAFGVSAKGTLVLAYHEQRSYDEAGNFRRYGHRDEEFRPTEIRVTRSTDDGLNWEAPRPLGVEAIRDGSPYGKVVALADGTLLMHIYNVPRRAVLGDRIGEAEGKGACSYVVRSSDDGLSWGEPAVVGIGLNETGLIALPGGDVLAVLRSQDEEQSMWSARSADGGRRWSRPERVTGPRMHPADLLELSNGDLLLAYGNRNPPYRVEGLVSRDGGRSWGDTLLTFSGHLYGYTVVSPRPYDLGYPSSALRRVGGRVEGVTMYYYNPSLNRPRVRKTDENGKEYTPREGEPFYSARDYYAIAVTWDEAELLAAIGRG